MSSGYDAKASTCRAIPDVSGRFGTKVKTEPISSRSSTAVRQILRGKWNDLPSLFGHLIPIGSGHFSPGFSFLGVTKQLAHGWMIQSQIKIELTNLR